jgi:hypothetical protein
VAILDVICEYCLPLVRPGGIFLAIKGERASAEVSHASRAIGTLGGAYDQTIASPTGQIVVIAKNSRTPRIYPRRDGEPKSKPLGGKMEIAEPVARREGGGKPAKVTGKAESGKSKSGGPKRAGTVTRGPKGKGSASRGSAAGTRAKPGDRGPRAK